MSDDAQHPVLLIEVSPASPTAQGGFQGQRAQELAREAASTALPVLADAISAAAQDFSQRILHSKFRPNEIELEMGVKLEGKFQWLIVAGGEATLTVRLKWSPQ